MTNRDFALRWAQTRTTDIAAHDALYAPDKKFVIELAKVDDHMEDSITEHAELLSRLAYWSNTDVTSGEGVHTITITEVIEERAPLHPVGLRDRAPGDIPRSARRR